MSKLLNVLFGCWHEWSWPFTIRKGQRVSEYQVCVKCGKEQPSNVFRAA